MLSRGLSGRLLWSSIFYPFCLVTDSGVEPDPPGYSPGVHRIAGESYACPANLHLSALVGLGRFELPTSASRTRRANQAAPQPVVYYSSSLA